MGAGTVAGSGTKIERRMEGRENLGTYEVIVEVGRKTRSERSVVTAARADAPAKPSHHAGDQSPGI